MLSRKYQLELQEIQNLAKTDVVQIFHTNKPQNAVHPVLSEL